MKIAVLLTCFNRKEKTLSCLTSLFDADLPSGYQFDVYLVYDGSTDGTADAGAKQFPQVKIIEGTGGLFWNRGMLKAWESSLASRSDFMLWLNDDTLIEPDSISKMLETHKALVEETSRHGIVVGATQNASGDLTYGGIVRPNIRRATTFKRLPPCDNPQPCLTMNGNCVLISRAVFERIGFLDGAYQHGMGDFDYGLRATKAGFPIWVAPGFVGYCENDNSAEGSYRDSSLPFRERWRKVLGPKGLPVSDWRLFCRRHAGFFWPIFWAWPYSKVVLTSLVRFRF
jgi:GT2 family glycosyltransferase